MDVFQQRFNQTEMNEGQTPVALANLAFSVNRDLYYASVGTCSLMLLGYGFIRWFRPKLDRLSLRLLIYAAVTHLMLAGPGVARTLPQVRGRLCEFVMFWYIFADISSTGLIMCISMNIQLVFVHELRRFKHLEFWYLLGSFLFAFIIALVPILRGHQIYSFNEAMLCCWYKNTPSEVASLWALLTVYLWICISILYSVTALFLVLIKMYHKESILNRHLANDSIPIWKRLAWIFLRPIVVTERRPRDTTAADGDVENIPDASLSLHKSMRTSLRRPSYILKTVSRVIWYPIILIISRIWGVINFAYSHQTGKISAFYTLMANVSVPLQGIILLFIFLIDPAFHRTIHDVWKSERGKDRRSPLPQPTPTPPPRRPSTIDRIMDMNSGISSVDGSSKLEVPSDMERSKSTLSIRSLHPSNASSPPESDTCYSEPLKLTISNVDEVETKEVVKSL